jgi:hypothetical protein
MSVKILNVTHRPCRLFNSADILTIHAGRACADKATKDGRLSVEQLEWLRKNTISDATGDNISLFNRYYNEMTAIYWAWKNYDKLGNPDAFGIMHYRRHFILKDTLRISGEYLQDLGLTTENIEKFAANYDIICPLFQHTEKHKKFIDCIGEEYCALGGAKMKQALKAALEIIKERDAADYEQVLSVLNGYETGSFCNMFIMKKEVFFAYCAWIFPILFELDKRLGRDYKQGEERCIGWTAEMLTSIFIYLQAKTRSHKEVLVFENAPRSRKSCVKALCWRLKIPFYQNEKQKKYFQKLYNHQLVTKYGLEEKIA